MRSELNRHYSIFISWNIYFPKIIIISNIVFTYNIYNALCLLQAVKLHNFFWLLLRVIGSEKPLNLEKTTSSVLSVLLLIYGNIWNFEVFQFWSFPVRSFPVRSFQVLRYWSFDLILKAWSWYPAWALLNARLMEIKAWSLPYSYHWIRWRLRLDPFLTVITE